MSTGFGGVGTLGGGGAGTSSGGASGNTGVVFNPEQGSGSGGESVGGIDEGSQCGGLQLDTSTESITRPGNVLILFDQSASMTTDFGGQPLWQAASTAVRDALVPNQDNLTIGAIFFPTVGDIGSLTFIGPCGPNAVAPIGQPPQIPFMPGPQFIQAWDQRWTAPNLVLSTPLDGATTEGAAALANAALEGQIVVIVVTDGEPTCTNSPGSVQIAQQWAKLGIPTYVIGLPGAGGATLTQLAQAGGTGSDFFTPGDAAGLQAELQKIMGTVVVQSLNDCGIVFNETPDNLSDVALVVTDADTDQRFKVEQGSEGWQLRADGSGADLLGTTCDEALSGRFSNISFEFGCEDIPVLR